MKRNQGQYILPDARGRILLPKKFRDHRLFEWIEKENGCLLVPMEVRPSPVKTQPKSGNELWVADEVDHFLKSKLIPKLQKFFNGRSPDWIQSAFFYGSRVRGDALSTSDFDLGLLVTSYPSMKLRSEISDNISAVLDSEFNELSKHGVKGEISVTFFPVEVTSEIPTIYYSLVEDHLLVWDSGRNWKNFLQRIKAVMRKKGVRQRGKGKRSTWTWRK